MIISAVRASSFRVGVRCHQPVPGWVSEEFAVALSEVSEGELREWYIAQRVVRLRLLGKRSLSVAADWQAAQNKFPGAVRRQAVRDLRDELAPDDWKDKKRSTERLPRAQ
jgi:hypothetical protein